MFPRRNRIVAGLSQKVLIVEAAAKSGSLITADFALRYKRQLLAVPGPITSKASEGTNRLIRDGLAKMVLSAEDVWPTAKTKPEVFSDNLLLNLLQEEALSVDELAKKLDRSVEELGVELSILQLKGQIFEDNGKFFVRI